ncbi:Hypothetical predicted protein [Mytilus galloprovincialis]|uniref:Uncharacterized protein n=1 Tax=Mytilus galloprovincialis TaxID=29158 RepID=A0A8B6HPF9_MYTGA|nr:Hypothetical predicted protein [Mytilus galloprovincialis]
MTVTAPTSCGKTFFVKQLLQNSRFIQPTIQRIIWLYDVGNHSNDTFKRQLDLPLDESKVHSDIVQQIQDIAENDTDYETQIRRILMKKRHQFDELFDDDYFEINTDTEDNDDEDDEEDTDEDIQEED